MVLRALGMRQHHMGTLLEVGGGGEWRSWPQLLTCCSSKPVWDARPASPLTSRCLPACLLPPPPPRWLQLCPTRSIWTIDLAHLLAACGARVQLLTLTIGANQVCALCPLPRPASAPPPNSLSSLLRALACDDPASRGHSPANSARACSMLLALLNSTTLTCPAGLQRGALLR